jgi:DNA-binding CsgD family transcriptional regulator
MEVFNPDPLPWRRYAALGLAALDRRDEAREVIDVAVERLRAYPAVRALGAVLRVRGLIEPDAAAALPWLTEAVSVLAPTVALLDRAYAEVALGGALRATGNRVEALEHLRTGLDLADRCGAQPLAREGRDALGARPRRASLTGRASLTPSEQRVAALAARGLTNREIAEALFVTMKTVTYHLGNAYRKLGTSAREDLAPLLED